jgi:hypothetical protein
LDAKVDEKSKEKTKINRFVQIGEIGRVGRCKKKEKGQKSTMSDR